MNNHSEEAHPVTLPLEQTTDTDSTGKLSYYNLPANNDPLSYDDLVKAIQKIQKEYTAPKSHYFYSTSTNHVYIADMNSTSVPIYNKPVSYNNLTWESAFTSQQQFPTLDLKCDCVSCTSQMLSCNIAETTPILSNGGLMMLVQRLYQIARNRSIKPNHFYTFEDSYVQDPFADVP